VKYSILVAEAAKKDFIQNASYIAKELLNPTAAKALLTDTDKAVASLEQMPYRRPLVRDRYLASLGIRMLHVRRYCLFYRVDEDKAIVQIIRQLHEKQNWQKVLQVDSEPMYLHEEIVDDYKV
jgi:plasmid stabilization system protein ParE